MSDRQKVPYNSIVQEIHSLCLDKATGTLFITGSNNSLAQISFKEGKIVLLACQNKQGLEAIPPIQKISSGFLQFIKMNISDVFSLPPTNYILSSLSDEVHSAASFGGSGSAVITKLTLMVLQETLVQYIGPAALLLCNDRLLGMYLDLAVEALAKEIENPKDAKRFKEEIKSKLQ